MNLITENLLIPDGNDENCAFFRTPEGDSIHFGDSGLVCYYPSDFSVHPSIHDEKLVELGLFDDVVLAASTASIDLASSIWNKLMQLNMIPKESHPESAVELTRELGAFGEPYGWVTESRIGKTQKECEELYYAAIRKRELEKMQ